MPTPNLTDRKRISLDFVRQKMGDKAYEQWFAGLQTPTAAPPERVERIPLESFERTLAALNGEAGIPAQVLPRVVRAYLYEAPQREGRFRTWLEATISTAKMEGGEPTNGEQPQVQLARAAKHTRTRKG